MSLLERYRLLHEHEQDSNHKTLTMLESVPETGRADARFLQAVTIANHVAICRENWLSHMDGEGRSHTGWGDARCDLASLRPRFVALETQWADYLARLDEGTLAQEFEFADNGEVFRLPIDVQIEQLVAHAAYHRGQIVLLVDQLGGETVDTDYVDWWWAKHS